MIFLFVSLNFTIGVYRKTGNQDDNIQKNFKLAKFHAKDIIFLFVKLSETNFHC